MMIFYIFSGKKMNCLTFFFLLIGSTSKQFKRNTSTNIKSRYEKEIRKERRRSYWRQLISIEMATIMGIAWYIKMELYRSNKCPSYYSTKHCYSCKLIESSTKKAAALVYNEMYRNESCGKFIISDSDNNDNLNGRIGYINYYDENKGAYQTIICSRDTTNMDGGFPMLMKTENMLPWNEVNHFQYNVKPKLDQITVSVDLPMNLQQEPVDVIVRENVFRNICGVQGEKRPETSHDSEIRYCLMNQMLHLIEKKEEDRRIQLEAQQKEHELVMEKFFANHLPRDQSRPFKKSKRIVTPTKAIDLRVDALWKAKVEHMKSTLIGGQNNNKREELLFTFPFVTNNNSLATCSHGLQELDAHHSNINDDSVLQDVSSEPLIMTTAAATSLAPGHEINSDVFDFCLGW